MLRRVCHSKRRMARSNYVGRVLRADKDIVLNRAVTKSITHFGCWACNAPTRMRTKCVPSPWAIRHGLCTSRTPLLLDVASCTALVDKSLKSDPI